MEMNKTKKVKIAYGGGRELGVKILKWLFSRDDVEIVAICPIPHDKDPEHHDLMVCAASEHGITLCDIEDILMMEVDIGISVNYHKIISASILSHCKKGFYNIHHSYNLRLRGRNIATHAIMNTLSENIHYHGTTFHKMSERLDEGAIIASTAIAIEDEDTAYSLFKKADKAAFFLFTEWFPRIAHEKVFPYAPPVEGVHSYRESDIPQREIIFSDMQMDAVDIQIRAFDFPGREPAFLLEGSEKVHLVKFPRNRYVNEYRIGDMIYFTDSD